MTQSDEDLLIKDLCARLPYNIAIDCRSEDSRFTCYLTTDILREIQNNRCYWEYKPYLFPMSSMTDEQKEEYVSLQQRVIYNSQGLVNLDVMKYTAWCYEHHIDINGLIPMGLALDATGLNIY